MESPIYIGPQHTQVSIFRQVPPLLQPINAAVAAADLAHAESVRRRYELHDWTNPYMVDIIRAFRLLEGAGAYVEIGTRDKGNLAWLAPKLAPGATMVDVDIDRFDEAKERLCADLVNIDYHAITGDSIARETVAQVKAALGPRQADAIFCDSSHMYDHTLAEFDLYFPLVKSGGVLMYHDCFWEGNEHHKGKCQAMEAIDRLIPVYCVYTTEPVQRYRARSEKGAVWGGVAIIIKP
jgi:predicted O-methyltransferase YrrM